MDFFEAGSKLVQRAEAMFQKVSEVSADHYARRKFAALGVRSREKARAQ